MLRRFLRWLVVALTAALIAHMLMRASSRPQNTAQATPAQSERIAAIPWAPALQASSRSSGPIPPMA